MSTQSDYQVTVSVDGKPLGVWDTRSGGDTDSDIGSKNTGEGRKLYHGRPNYADLTVSRDFERERDHELSRTLERRAGRAPMTVSEQPLDEDGNAWGKPKVWTGKLKSVNTGEYDADSGDPRTLELTMVTKDLT